jgi:holliday junction DNA helicase RuvA
MITKITGVINRVLDEELRLQVGAFEYQVLVPEFVRRQVQTRTGQELTLHISEYLEGNQMSSRFIPRRIGFLSESELDFFDLFCTVDKIGVKKALKALGRPIKEIADAIQRKDAKWLTTLPGIGKTTADQIVATLNTKVTRFALMPSEGGAVGASSVAPVNAVVFEDAYAALMSVGLTPTEARVKIDQVIMSGKECKSVEEVIGLVFKRAE